MQFVCPHCQTKYSAHSRLGGRTTRCPGCDKTIRIPTGFSENENFPAVIPIETVKSLATSTEPRRVNEKTPIDLVPSLDRSKMASSIPAVEQLNLGNKAKFDKQNFADVDADVTANSESDFEDNYDDESLERDSPLSLRKDVAGLNLFDSVGTVDHNDRFSGSAESFSVKELDHDSPEDHDEEEDLIVSFKKSKPPKDEIDMTAMVDVTFLLLIFFMVTASFTSEKAIQQKASTSDKASKNAVPQQTEANETVRILIDEFNAYTVILPDSEEREATSKQELIAILDMAALEGSTDDATTLVVEAHEDSIHAAVVSAIDAGREKNFTQFQVNVVENFD